jgi:molybdopterin/thiamine biosynthesis adenylyltransferase
VLRGFDNLSFRERLENHVIALAYDRAAAEAGEARAALDLSVRCLARLYPKLLILPLGNPPPALWTKLRALALAINPAVDLDAPREEVSVCLTFGTTPSGARTEIFCGSDRWVAEVSTQSPIGSGKTRNPFGAGAAACIGSANVFRAVFGEQLARGVLDGRGRLSLLNFKTGEEAANGSLPSGMDLTHCSLVGLGAVGNGAVWALSRLPAPIGQPFLIEPELVELSNLQRYVLALQRHIGLSKLNLAHEAFQKTKVEPRLVHGTWSDFVVGIGHAPLDRVAVALDSARDRIQVQAALPRRIFNAWTQTGDLGVSRHGFGETPCLACLYLPSDQAPHMDELVGQAIGLAGPEHRHRLREMLIRGDAVGEPFVREVAAALGVRADDLLPFSQSPLHAFYREAICGGLLLRLGAKTQALEAPLVFQSAMAGIMLAAEIVADLGRLRHEVLPLKSVLDLTRPLPRRLNMPFARRPRADGVRCLCEDQLFLAEYRARYGPAHLDTSAA